MTHQGEAPAEVHEHYVPVAGARIYLREVGRGHPIVILHGGPDFNHNYLLPELDRLSSAYRLIYYDQRGRGRSSPGVAAEDVSVESELHDLDQLRQQLGFDAFALLGHSWGCLLALAYAARHSNRVSHLILLNPAPVSYADRQGFREQRGATEAAVLAAMRVIASTPEYGRGEISTEAAYYRAHFSKAVFRPDQVETVVRRLRVHFLPEDILKARTIENRLYSETTSSPGYDLTPGLRKLKIPTLVIHGDHDFIPLDCAKNVADPLLGSRLVVLRDCGHFASLERPAEVFDAITAFLAQR